MFNVNHIAISVIDNKVSIEYYKKFGFNIDGIAMFNKDWKKDIEG